MSLGIQRTPYSLRTFLVLNLIGSLASAAPRMVIEDGSWDFGKVYEGSQPEHVFKLRNAGDAPLIIAHIRGSCAPCAGAMISGRKIAPGKTGDLKVVYNAKEGMKGKVSAFLTIHSNDPANPFQRVNIKGTILPIGNAPVLSVSPSPMDIGVLWAGQERTVAIELRNKGKSTLEVKDIATSEGVQIAGKIAEVEPGKKASLTVRVVREGLRGLVQEWVKIGSNDPAHPETLIPVYGYAAAGKAPESSAGVTLVPVGPGIAVPGTGKALRSDWVLVNNLSTPISISLPGKPGEAKTTLQAGDVPPGARKTFRVEPAEEPDAGKQVIRIEIEIPILVGRSRENE